MSDLFESNDLVDNVPEFSVSDISRAIKKMIEGEFSYVKIRGELGRVSKPASGHIYLDIKDEKSVLSGIVWKPNIQSLEILPEEGLEVIATGRLTTFPGQSRYQIIIEHLSAAGVGSLMLMLEKRKQKFLEEGLFANNRKIPLPFVPEIIGIITSPSGAVLKDILHRLKDRFPRHVIVWPVTVQGERCSFEVESAIKGFNVLDPNSNIPKPNLLIVARGGGSVEDLWGFNEERVVRAAAQSKIPIISAIGHETDVTLLDYVSDKRAPTPTAAAEMAVPVRADLLSVLSSLNARRVRQVKVLFDTSKSKLKDLLRILPRPEHLISEHNQYLDLIISRFENAIKSFINQKKLNYARSGSETLQPKLLLEDVARKKVGLKNLSTRSSLAINIIFSSIKNKCVELDRLHESLSYKKTLERGYVIVRDSDKKIVYNAEKSLALKDIVMEFKDGYVKAQVKNKV